MAAEDHISSQSFDTSISDTKKVSLNSLPLEVRQQIANDDAVVEHLVNGDLQQTAKNLRGFAGIDKAMMHSIGGGTRLGRFRDQVTLLEAADRKTTSFTEKLLYGKIA